MAGTNRIKKLFKSIFSKLYVSKQDYKDSRDEIRNSNLNMLSASSLIVAPLYTFLFTLSFILSSGKINRQRYLYLAVAALSLLIFVISIAVLPKRQKFITLSLYSFLMIMYAHGLVNGIFIYTLSHSVIFFVLQIVSAILIVDKTLRIITFSAVWAALYIVLAIRFKPYSIAVTDSLDVICFFIVGSMMNMYLSHMRTREFTLQQTIKTERDTDGLTGLLNKESLTREIKRSLIKNPTTGILLLMDLDDFKKINDTYGHDIGDKVLSSVAKILKDEFRKADIIGRFGGDEFIIYMTGTDDLNVAKSKAIQSLENMRDALKTTHPEVKIHGSFGIAPCSRPEEDYNDLFKKADNALYAAKKSGKNQVFVSEEI